MDDNSGSFAASVALNGITSIAPGESAIFIETGTPSATAATFLNTWFGANPPAGLQIGSYTGSGVGLGTGGDAVNVYNAGGSLQASVLFGSSPTGTFKTFDNAAKLNNTTISQLSAVGINGAFIARNDTSEIGSPGAIVSPPCATISVTATETSPILCYGDSATVTVSVTGGTEPYKGIGIFKRAAGTYTFIVTDAYGCSGSADITITEPQQLAAPTVNVVQPVCWVTTGVITITSSTSGLTFSLDSGAFAVYPSGGYVVAPGAHTLRAQNNNGCISASASITVNPPPTNCGPVDPNKCYVIVNRNTSKVVTVTNAKLNDGAPVVQQAFNNGSNQKFKFTDAGDGYYKITAQHSGKVIGVQLCASSQNASLVQQTYAGADCQKWSLTKQGNYYIIKNKKSGRVMAVINASTTQVVQQTQNNNNRQQWSLVEISCSAIAIASVNSGSASEPDAISKMDKVLDATVFPNPAPDQFTIVISGTSKQSIQLLVKDNLGRTVEMRKNIAPDAQITLGSKYRGGVYYLEIIQGDNKIVRKMIKL